MTHRRITTVRKRHARPEVTIAKHIHVTEESVSVDGKTLPWYVAREPINVHLDTEGFQTVRLTLIANRVTTDVTTK